MADPKLMSLYREIGLVRAREIQQLQELDAAESAATWGKLQEAWGQFTRATAAGNLEAMHLLMPAIGRLIEHGAEDIDRWSELYKTQEHMRKLTESEAKIRLSAAKVVTLAELYNIMAAFRSVVIREVADKGQAQNVIDGVRAVIVENNLLGDADADSD